jgi:hypothetical protein
MRHGPDISHWQAQVDLATAKASIDFVILKATQRHNYLDPTFRARWAQAAELGLPRIAYHYAEVGGDPLVQANWFVDKVREVGVGGRWAVALDFEDPAGGTPTGLWAWADGWIRSVRLQLIHPVCFYSFPAYLRDTLQLPTRMPGGWQTVDWIARYVQGNDPWVNWTRPLAFPAQPSLWQITNGHDGQVTDIPGIGKVDYNRMSESAFDYLFGETPPEEELTWEEVAAIRESQNDPDTPDPDDRTVG